MNIFLTILETMYSAIEHYVNMALYKCCILLLLLFNGKGSVLSTSTICSCFSVIRICLIKQSFVIAMGHTKLDIAEKACI